MKYATIAPFWLHICIHGQRQQPDNAALSFRGRDLRFLGATMPVRQFHAVYHCIMRQSGA